MVPSPNLSSSPVLSDALVRAAEASDRRIIGDPLVGWQGRTAGATVADSRGERAWLRVVVARRELARGEWWNGNADAEILTRMRRPRIIACREWSDGAVCFRSELMELLPGQACSSTPELREDLALDDRWWRALESNLAALAGYRTPRASTTAASLVHRCRVLFGVTLDLSRVEWATSHGDLHWANVFAPEFALVDWEAWGSAPWGSDIAGLYLHSLRCPQIAETILERFPAVFESASGRVGLMFHASRMLARAMAGEYPDLVDPIHQAVRRFAPPSIAQNER